MRRSRQVRIVVVGDCEADYLAKCHEAFRTGLRRLLNARMFGRGYEAYRADVTSYSEAIEAVCPGGADVVIASFDFDSVQATFPYKGLAEVKARRGVVLGDYWTITNNYRDRFLGTLQQNGVSFVLSYFPRPLELYRDAGTDVDFYLMLPSFDPAIFNDWQMEKEYDVGFLAAGTAAYSPVYPERFLIHRKLRGQGGLRYLWAEHPGWQRHPADHPLVGQGFSKSINSCHMFVTTAGVYRNPHAKYVEILASRSLLLADEPEAAQDLGLKEGENYVRISAGDVLDKVHYYLNNPAERERIAKAGYLMAMERHTCYARAADFLSAVEGPGVGALASGTSGRESPSAGRRHRYRQGMEFVRLRAGLARFAERAQRAIARSGKDGSLGSGKR